MKPRIKTLPSGYIHIHFSTQIWAQVPPGFDLSSEEIPSEFIFQDPVAFNQSWRSWTDRPAGVQVGEKTHSDA